MSQEDNEYELQRRLRIEKNRSFLTEIGLTKEVTTLYKKKTRTKKKSNTKTPSRQSTRLSVKQKVNYDLTQQKYTGKSKSKSKKKPKAPKKTKSIYIPTDDDDDDDDDDNDNDNNDTDTDTDTDTETDTDKGDNDKAKAKPTTKAKGKTVGKTSKRSIEQLEGSEEEEKPKRRATRKKLKKLEELPKSNSSVHKILFTGIDTSKLTVYLKMVNTLGGIVVENPYNCTHVVVEKLKRTMKLFSCIKVAPFILTVDWLFSSHKNNVFLDEEPFWPKKNNFPPISADLDIKRTITIARKQPPSNGIFNNLSFFLSSRVQDIPLMKELITMYGGKVLTTAAVAASVNKVYAITASGKLPGKLKDNSNVCSTTREFIFCSILEQQLRLDLLEGTGSGGRSSDSGSSESEGDVIIKSRDYRSPS